MSYQNARFVDVDMTGAVFREVDLSGVRMRGVYLSNVDIDGAIDGLRINGVDVGPLIEAELDRLHPERTKLRPTDAAGAREAWATVEAMWAPTMARAATLTDEQVHRSVDDEWSFVDTLRHLVFAMDSWFGNSVLGQDRPFHPWGIPFTSDIDFSGFGLDLDARPSLAEIAQVRAERWAQLRSYLDTQTDDDFARVRPARCRSALAAAGPSLRSRVPAGHLQRGVGPPPVRNPGPRHHRGGLLARCPKR